MTSPMRTISLPSGDKIPVLGQGTWGLGESRARRSSEIAALRRGLDIGMNLIDTAEMYANGDAEILVGEAIAGRREEVFLVTKVWPYHATREGTVQACQGSLRRLNTDWIDLYLLHWRGPVPLAETLEAFRDLRNAGLIRNWGVSNFDVSDLDDLMSLPGSLHVATDQVLYNFSRRAPEFDLFPACRELGIPIMAYSPVEQGRILGNPVLRDIATRLGASPAGVCARRDRPARSRSRTRPVFDTPPPFPVWELRSGVQRHRLPAGPGQLRLHRHHGLEHGRGPSGRVPVVMEAKARGARVIHVDPRFTRTSALADQHVTVRAGTDIAFLGGVINRILANNLEFQEYVPAYTNAPFLLNEQYQDTEDLDGLFSEYDPHAAAYDRSSWSYESVVAESASGARHKEQSSPYQSGSGGPVLEGAAGELADDPSLERPRCVFQILKRHFARYTPEMVERICGVPRDLFLKVCRAWTENSGRERTAALVYSVGWTQHSVGPQYIRAGAII